MLNIFRRHDWKKPLAEINFVVFDTETTGLDIRRDRILSIGAVRMNNYRIEVNDSLELLIAQVVPFGAQEVAVHGILPGRSRQGMEEQTAVAQFSEFCKGSVLVGHHIAFDIAMVNRALQRAGCPRLTNLAIDTFDLAKRVNPPGAFIKPNDYSLDRLCQLYHLPDSDRHTAAGDAFITALLLMKLLARLQKRGVKNLGDLLRRF